MPSNTSPWSEVKVSIAITSDSIDRGEVRRAFEILTDPAHAFEVRGINPLGHAHGQVCTTIDEGVEAVAAHSMMAGVYVCLNPIQADAKSASKATVVSRRWILLDIDPVRPKDCSSTDEEKASGVAIVGQVLDYLHELGWPNPVIHDSGNGWHMLYAIDLPNDKLSQQIIKRVIYSLADRFDTLQAWIDRATHDAPRIAKIPGTWARKGINTPERPWRMARIIMVPDQIEAVSIELLQALGGKKTEAGGLPLVNAWGVQVSSSQHDLSAYVRRAVEGELGKLSMANEGTRNTALNQVAFTLGQFTQWPEFDVQSAREALARTARQIGLGDTETSKTIESGWNAGAKQPRQRPIDPRANGQAQPQILNPSEPIIRGLSEIIPQKVEWLWEDRVAIGFISIFAGRTSMGKSLCLCDLAARLSRGDAPAFSKLKTSPCSTLIISEDPQETMLAPRLRVAGAFVGTPGQGNDRVMMMTWSAMAAYTLDNTRMLDRAYEMMNNPKLIAIDPPSNFLGRRDEHKNAEMRQVLMMLVTWINERKVAMILLNHLNKQSGKGLDAIERIMGSVAWASVARITLAFDRDPNEPDRYLCGGTKNNLGPIAGVLGFQTVATEGVVKLEWTGQVDTSMEDALNRVKKKPRAIKAAEWLIERFIERKSWPSDDLYTAGRSEGISRSAIWEAAKGLPLIRTKEACQDGTVSFWLWSAPENWPPERKSETLETLDENRDFSRENPAFQSGETVETLAETLDEDKCENRQNAKDDSRVSRVSSVSSVSTVSRVSSDETRKLGPKDVPRVSEEDAKKDAEDGFKAF